MRPVLLALLILATPAPRAHAYACLDPADPDGRRWFQDEPCPPGLVDSPLPLPVQLDDPTPPPYRFLPGQPATDGSIVYPGRRWHGSWRGHGGHGAVRPGVRGRR